MKNLLIVSIVLLSSLSCIAQEKITGTLPGWDKGKADIVMGLASEPFVVGLVDQSGAFTFTLTDDLIAKTQKNMEEQNSGSSGWRLRLNPISEAFSCLGGDTLSVKNGDQVANTPTTMGGIPVADLQKKKMYGTFMAADSKPFAEALRSLEKKDAVKGFYLNWYYLKEPASVNGTCNWEAYAVNQKELYKKAISYNLNFQKGWNLVQISADETFTDKEGKSYASKWTYRTVDEMPEDARYLFFEQGQ